MPRDERSGCVSSWFVPRLINDPRAHEAWWTDSLRETSCESWIWFFRDRYRRANDSPKFQICLLRKRVRMARPYLFARLLRTQISHHVFGYFIEPRSNEISRIWKFPFGTAAPFAIDSLIPMLRGLV